METKDFHVSVSPSRAADAVAINALAITLTRDGLTKIRLTGSGGGAGAFMKFD